MTTPNVGTDELLMPAQKCTEHALTFQYSIGLPSTDNHLIGEKVANLECSKSTKNNTVSGWSNKFGKGDDHNPWEGIFSVKYPLKFFWL